MTKPKIEIKELNAFVKKNIREKEEIAKFFYFWISLNIEYDFELRDKIRKELDVSDVYDRQLIPGEAFAKKKAVCSGFANLYEYFMDEFEIECEVIEGYVKYEENITVEPEFDTHFGHAWNAIKIKNRWILVDVTWAKQFDTTVSEFHFSPDPEKFLLTHYPTDNKWQLLKQPLPLDEFNKLPIVHPFYFQTGFPQRPKLNSDQEYYYLEVAKNPNRNWLLKLTYSSDRVNFKSVYPEYFDKQTSHIYRIEKALLSNKSILSIGLTDFNENEQSFVNYGNIILFFL